MTASRVPSLKGSLLALLAFVACVVAAPASAAGSETRMTGLQVSGNAIVNVDGQRLFIHGVNRAGTEYQCTKGGSQIFDGPADQRSIDAMKTWNINAVRVPLNEDCWLAVNITNSKTTGQAYRTAIKNWVDLITANNMVAIVELHWAAQGQIQATFQNQMPDVDHSIDFWRSVATTFKANSAVIFDLYNEPFPDFVMEPAQAWLCLRDGRDACPGLGFQAVGMQELLDTVRATGATNVVMTTGLEYGNDMRDWKKFAPVDPLNNLAASWHAYDFNRCAKEDCWERDTAVLTNTVPVIAGEISSIHCNDYYSEITAYLERRQQSYTAWAWNNYGSTCKEQGLISDYYNATPTPAGQKYRDHIASLPWTYEGAGPRKAGRQELILTHSFEGKSIFPWFFQVDPPARSRLKRVKETSDNGPNSVRVVVPGPTPGEAYHSRLSQVRIPFKKGVTYTLKFAAKSNFRRPFTVVLQQVTPPYAVYDGHEVTLTPDWQTFVFNFTPTQDDSYAQIGFQFADFRGTVWLDSVSLR